MSLDFNTGTPELKQFGTSITWSNVEWPVESPNTRLVSEVTDGRTPTQLFIQALKERPVEWPDSHTVTCFALFRLVNCHTAVVSKGTLSDELPRVFLWHYSTVGVEKTKQNLFGTTLRVRLLLAASSAAAAAGCCLFISFFVFLTLIKMRRSFCHEKEKRETIIKIKRYTAKTHFHH